MKKSKTALPEANTEVAAPEKAAKKKTGRIFIIISYLLALASIIAVLFVPLYDGKMAVQYVWAAAENLLKFLNIKVPAFAYGDFFIAKSLRIYESVLILGLAGSAVLAVIMLLPVTICKKPHSANLRCAFAAEFIAFLVATCCCLWELFRLKGDWQNWNNFAILIPFGVTMLIMAAQSIKFKGGLGVAKLIIFLLSLLTIITLFDICKLLPMIEEPILSLAELIKAYSTDATYTGNLTTGISVLKIFVNLYKGQPAFVDPSYIEAFVYQVLTLALVVVTLLSVWIDFIGLIAGNKTKKNGEPHPHKGWFVFAAIRYSLIILMIAAEITLSFVLENYAQMGIYMYFTAVLVLLTFIVEIIRYCVCKSKVKAYRKQQKAISDSEKLVIEDETLAVEDNVVEQQINMFGEEPAAQATAVETVVEEAPAESADEQLSIMDAQPVEAEVVAQPVEAEVVAQPAEAEVVAQPVAVVEEAPAEEPVVVAQPVEEKVVAQPVEAEVVAQPVAVVEEAPAEEPVVVAQPIDTSFSLFGEEGKKQETAAIDPFIDKLSDEERAQFYDIFVNRNKGKFSFIPAYVMNGDNSDFFPSVFVHINRMRNLCCDSLLAKIYKEIDKD